MPLRIDWDGVAAGMKMPNVGEGMIEFLGVAILANRTA